MNMELTDTINIDGNNFTIKYINSDSAYVGYLVEKTGVIAQAKTFDEMKKKISIIYKMLIDFEIFDNKWKIGYKVICNWKYMRITMISFYPSKIWFWMFRKGRFSVTFRMFGIEFYIHESNVIEKLIKKIKK